jgi:cysteine desulfurase
VDRQIYLDNNATTPLLPAVLEAMLPYFTEAFANPASSHRPGRRAHRALEDARESIAGLLDADADEVIFTSGATEANNLALFGLVQSLPSLPHLLASPIEHPCVAEPLQRLGEMGCQLSYLPVDETGIVQWHDDALRPETRVMSVMLANHETGAVQPIADIAEHLGERALFHCDAAAAVGKMAVSFRKLGVTALTVSAHKFHGPKGIGALVLRKRTRLQPLFRGGHQQQGRRPGTESVPLIVGFARALELAMQNLERHTAHVTKLRQRFLSLLQTHAAPVIVNGPVEGGIVSTVNLSFPGCQADALHMALDLAGIACSTGSACSSGSLLPSPVLRAMGVDRERLHSAMRFSLSPLVTLEDIEDACRLIAQVVGRLRTLS